MLKTLTQTAPGKFTITANRRESDPVSFYGDINLKSKFPATDQQILDLNISAASAALGLTPVEVTEFYIKYKEVTWIELDSSPTIHSPSV